ncbi:hypothetical protein VNO77_19914 [Canavalia gladiata]|uniref:Uncharacterized protein n=1 Tax=Canavalia gladiata TaxID=3824 RepID=A0AAN9QQ21_CANGL
MAKSKMAQFMQVFSLLSFDWPIQRGLSYLGMWHLPNSKYGLYFEPTMGLLPILKIGMEGIKTKGLALGDRACQAFLRYGWLDGGSLSPLPYCLRRPLAGETPLSRDLLTWIATP